MKAPSGMFRHLRKAVAGTVTAEPRCDCGRVVPVKHWSLHRATCPVIERRPPTPTHYEHDPRD